MYLLLLQVIQNHEVILVAGGSRWAGAATLRKEAPVGGPGRPPKGMVIQTRKHLPDFLVR